MEVNISNSNKGLSSGPKPSIFEIVAEESLQSLLHPAFGHILRIISCKLWHYPNLKKFLQYPDELFTFMKGLIETHYILGKNSTFSEDFYGLSREKMTGSVAGATEVKNLRLSKKDKILSVLSVVLIPYINHKLEKFYNAKFEDGSSSTPSLNDEDNRNQVKGKVQGCNNLKIFTDKVLSQLSQVFKNIYPVLSTTGELVKLVFFLLYILTGFKCHSLTFAILGLRLKYKDVNRPVSTAVKSLGSKWDSSFPIVPFLIDKVSILLNNGLPAMVFFLKFLEWWYEEGMDTKAHSLNSLPTPEPPQEPEVRTTDLHFVHPSCCPLCEKVHQSPTTLSVSGYVFCYKCIYTYLLNEKRCPITHVPCNFDDLIRLYAD